MVKALNCRRESDIVMNIYNIVSDLDIPNGHTKRMPVLTVASVPLL